VSAGPPRQASTLCRVDPGEGGVKEWSPPAALRITYPWAPESLLTGKPDLSVASARDLEADANLWLLHSGTVPRVNFGRPLAQADFSFDPPPDREVRPKLDYRLLREATVGDRELF